MTNVAKWLSALINHYFKNGPQNGQEVVLYITHSELIEAWRNNFPDSEMLDNAIVTNFYKAVKDSSNNQDFFREAPLSNIPTLEVETYLGNFHIPKSLLWLSAVILAVTESEDDTLHAGNYYRRISDHLNNQGLVVANLPSNIFGSFYKGWIIPTEKRFNRFPLQDNFGKLFRPEVIGNAYTDWIKGHTILKVAQVNKLPNLFKSLKLGSKSSPSISKWRSLFINEIELFKSELGLWEDQLNTLAPNGELSEQFIRFLNSRLVNYELSQSKNLQTRHSFVTTLSSNSKENDTLELVYQIIRDKENFQLMPYVISDNPILIDDDVFDGPCQTGLGKIRYQSLPLKDWQDICNKYQLKLNDNWVTTPKGKNVKILRMPERQIQGLFAVEQNYDSNKLWTAVLTSSNDSSFLDEFGVSNKIISFEGYTLSLYFNGIPESLMTNPVSKEKENQISISSPFSLGYNRYLGNDPYLYINFSNLEIDDSKPIQIFEDQVLKEVSLSFAIPHYQEQNQQPDRILDLKSLKLSEGRKCLTYYDKNGNQNSFNFEISRPNNPKGVKNCFNQFGENSPCESIVNNLDIINSDFLPLEYNKSDLLMNTLGYTYGFGQNNQNITRNSSLEFTNLNIFLDYVDFKGSISYEDGKTIISEIISDILPGFLKPSRVLQNLASLGFILINYTENRIIAIKPYALMIPSTSGPTLGIFGTISTTKMEKLVNHQWVHFFKANRMDITTLKIIPNGTGNRNTFNSVEELLNNVEIGYIRYNDNNGFFSTASILSNIGSVKDYYNHLLSKEESVLNLGTKGFKTFLPDKGWIINENDQNFEGVLEYNDGYRKSYYWSKDGKWFETEKQWAIWLTIWKAGWIFGSNRLKLRHNLPDQNIELSFYIKENCLITSPSIKPPLIFEQAIIKRSGSLPSYENNLLVYQIGTSATDLINHLNFFLAQ